MSTQMPTSGPSAPTSGSNLIQGDLRVNNLVYRQPDSLSLATNRTMKRQKFQQSSYSAGDTAVIIWNTGSDYIRTCNSYLVFDMVCTGSTPTANFGVGSAVNVIDSILITTRSGTELDRIHNLNLHSAKTLRQLNSQDWVDNYGSMMGMGSTGVAGTDGANVTSNAAKFVIPLSKLSGVFDPIGGVLMPPMLAAGLEIHLSLADYRTALFQKSGTVTGYTLSNISIMCDCVSLSDRVQKTLNDEASKNGLEYTYNRWHTSKTVATSTDVSIQIEKSVAQAQMLYATMIAQSRVLSVTADSFASDTWDVSEWQARIGSLYQPNEAVKDSAQDGLESYFIFQSVYDKAKYSHAENSISVADFTSIHGCIATSFERDQALNLSGQAVNNSRQVELNVTLASWSANINVTAFLQYVCVARAFMDNCAVSI